jgi:hypothetical protein|tara:strand:- start:115 stop:483 length:369 start_codon:yes stop_codon:yes gene_type:complete
MTWGQLVMNTGELLGLLKDAHKVRTKDYIFDDFRIVVIESIVDFAHREVVAYIGMMLILGAFFLETRDILHSKAVTYLGLMAVGSGLLGIRAYLIDEWAFFILEIAWFIAAILGLITSSRNN